MTGAGDCVPREQYDNLLRMWEAGEAHRADLERTIGELRLELTQVRNRLLEPQATIPLWRQVYDFCVSRGICVRCTLRRQEDGKVSCRRCSKLHALSMCRSRARHAKKSTQRGRPSAVKGRGKPR